MKVDKNLKDQMLFIKKFVTEPRTIGSVTPSSPQLVDSMLQNADWAKLGAVAERGIFAENHAALRVGENFQRVPLADPQRAADLLRDHDSAEVVDAAHDSSCFHIAIPP